MSEQTEQFDPNAHTAAEVKAHLDTADPAEFARVIAAETQGQARVTVLGYSQTADHAPLGADGYARRVIATG